MKTFMFVLNAFGTPYLLMLGFGLVGADFGYLKCFALGNCFGIPLSLAVYTGIRLAKAVADNEKTLVNTAVMDILTKGKSN